MSARSTVGYCSWISSGESPVRKAATSVLRVTRLPPTRTTPSASVSSGTGSGATAIVILTTSVEHTTGRRRHSAERERAGQGTAAQSCSRLGPGSSVFDRYPTIEHGLRSTTLRSLVADAPDWPMVITSLPRGHGSTEPCDPGRRTASDRAIDLWVNGKEVMRSGRRRPSPGSAILREEAQFGLNSRQCQQTWC